MNINDLMALAQAAGFPADAAPTAAAIAMAESSGTSNAIGDNGVSFGLWQIDILYHPEYAANPAVLLDPATNAAAAYKIWWQDGGSFREWTGSYTNGKYLQYLPPATFSPTTSTMPLPATMPVPASSPNSSLWAALAIGAAILFGLGYALEES